LPAKSTRKKKRRGGASRSNAPPRREESRGAEALTVLWMLATLATLFAEAAAAGAALLSPAPPPGEVSLGNLLPEVMLFTALVTGTISLTATPLVLRLRREAPPRVIVGLALLIGVSPWLIFAAALVRK
jgi:hypothetical protein